jgi:DNA-binding transcriptional ArsR family regulator
METYVIKRLEQAKLLTDPFKLKLIEGFGGAPATTKQVADKMGEKAPRLYRHVDALVDEGLLELVEEKPKRGTIERYYRTVADRFEVDPELFSPSSGNGADALDMVRSLIRDTESDLVNVFNEIGDSTPEPEAVPMVMKLAIRGTPEEIAELRGKLMAWLDDCENLSGDAATEERRATYSGLLAFYPRPSSD